MRLLIDGYNFLNCAGIVVPRKEAYSLEASRIAVVKFVQTVLPAAECQRTVVVFDGRESPPGLPQKIKMFGIEVRFSQRGAEADDLIEHLINQTSDPRRLTVVSSDHRVQRAAKRRKAKAVDSEVWFEQKRRKSTVPQPVDVEKPALSVEPGELAEWIHRCAHLKTRQNARENSAGARRDSTNRTDHVFPVEYLRSLQDEVDQGLEPNE